MYLAVSSCIGVREGLLERDLLDADDGWDLDDVLEAIQQLLPCIYLLSYLASRPRKRADLEGMLRLIWDLNT